MKKLFLTLAIMSTPVLACDFSAMGDYQCYSDKNKKNEIYTLKIESDLVNNMRALRTSRKYKGESSSVTGSFTMGSFKKTYDEAFKNEIRKRAYDNIIMLDFAVFDEGRAFGHYKGYNSCTQDEIKLNTQYFSVIADLMENFESDVKKSITMKIKDGMIVVNEKYENQEEGQNGFTPGKSYVDYCFKK